MPQMAPYNWLMLFLLFNMIMMFIISYNHYSTINYSKNSLMVKKNFFFKWMW